MNCLSNLAVLTVGGAEACDRARSPTGPVGERVTVFLLLAYTKCYAELRRELVTKSKSGGYDQLEPSPEEIEQELRTAFCERSQT